MITSSDQSKNFPKYIKFRILHKIKKKDQEKYFIILKAENKMLILGGHLDNTYFNCKISQ